MREKTLILKSITSFEFTIYIASFQHATIIDISPDSVNRPSIQPNAVTELPLPIEREGYSITEGLSSSHEMKRLFDEIKKEKIQFSCSRIYNTTVLCSDSH